ARPLGWRARTPAPLREWAEGLDEPLREEALRLIEGPAYGPEDFRYRQEAEHCARNLRADQARRLQRRLLLRLADDADGDHAETLARLHTLTEFIAAVTTPRRSSTFPDLRDVLGRE
ncbi:MAG TPA: DNA primase, partial [Chloroflexaceae bacterium]|nr:DNA primase [Chloroflexaceae bacterium]